MAPWASGRVTAAGGVNTRANGRTQAWTVTHTAGTGSYTITFGQHHPNGTGYGIVCSAAGGYLASYTAIMSNYLTSCTYNAAGTLTDQEFSFHTIP